MSENINKNLRTKEKIFGSAYSKNGKYLYYIVDDKIQRYSLKEKFDYYSLIETSMKIM